MLKLIRKTRGRSYEYKLGQAFQSPWYVMDEEGKIFKSPEEVSKAKTKVVKKKVKTKE